MTPVTDPTAASASLLAFWADAGVDACYLDAAVDRTVVIAPPTRPVVVASNPAATARVDHTEVIGQARAIAATAQTLAELVEAASAFTGCGLRTQGARRAVVGDGPDDAAVLVLGAAPGEAEDAGRGIFAGPAGDLFGRLVAEAGLSGRIWRMNSVFWRPPGDRQATVEEQALCLPFVERALAILKPKAALLLGAAPARAALGATGSLADLRGDWRPWRPAEGGGLEVPSRITVSPAFLLRQPLAKRDAWADLLELAARVDG